MESLPVSEIIYRCVFTVPWFKHYRPAIIEEHANAYKKVVDNYKVLLAGDEGYGEDTGGYSSFFSEQRKNI